MKIGVSLLGLRGTRNADTAAAAEALGYESVWLSDHLVLPGHAATGAAHGSVPPSLPILDVGGLMTHIACRTTSIRVGTWVYVLPLRHPLVSARVFQTADILSDGRVEIGVGVGYVPEEFAAAGVDFRRRGAVMDEALLALKSLLRDERPEFHGEFYRFGPVSFEPKPAQRPWPPLHVGGYAHSALRRAVREGDGWIGGEYTPKTLAPVLETLRRLEDEERVGPPLQVTVGAGNVIRAASFDELPLADPTMVAEFEALGVDRVIVRPWIRSRDAIEGLRRFADECGLSAAKG